MNWFKDSLLDILFLILAVVLAFTGNQVIYIICWIYTGLLLFAKVAFFFINFLQTKANKTNTPDWFYHLIYFLTITVLLTGTNYYLAGSWVLIWILSYMAQKKNAK